MLSSPPLSTNGVRPLLILQSCIITMLRCLYCTFFFFCPATIQGGVPHQAHAARHLHQVVVGQQIYFERLRRNEHPNVEGQRRRETGSGECRVFFFFKLMSHWLSHPEGGEICPPLMTHRLLRESGGKQQCPAPSSTFPGFGLTWLGIEPTTHQT